MFIILDGIGNRIITLINYVFKKCIVIISKIGIKLSKNRK